MEGSLTDAITQVRAIVNTEQTETQRSLDEVESIYQNILHYFSQGVEDEKVPNLLLYIRRKLIQMLNRWELNADVPIGTGFFFDRMRYRRSIGFDSIATLCKHIHESEQRKKYDDLLKNLFDALWTSEKLSDEDVAALSASSEYVRLTAISALSMSLLQYWDETKVRFLIDELSKPYSTPDYIARILIALTLTLRKHRYESLLYEADLMTQLEVKAADLPLSEYIEELYVRFYYACQTEQISKKLKEEVLDNMQEILPKMQKFGIKDFEQQQDLDPEWMEELERSGLNKKIQEFTELQQDGADVMHSTFMNLKNHSFFRDLHHWFLPFDVEHHLLSNVLGDSALLNKLAEGLSTQLCDSDRYSLILSLEQMPAHMRSKAFESMGAEIEQMQEQMQSSNAIPDGAKQMGQAFKNYIQNLYRFYKLYERKLELEDVFAYDLPIELPLWRRYLQESSSRNRFAEFFFRHKQYKQAANLFVRLATEAKTDAHLYKKLGYCYEQLASFDLALDAYSKADLIDPDNDWLQKRLAYCWRKQGNIDKAIALIENLFDRKQGETQLLLQLGRLYLEAERFDDALKCLHRYEYEGANPGLSHRAIAWASFLSGNYPKAADYYKQLIEQQEHYNDYLNAGHTALAMNDLPQALRYFRRSIELNPNGMAAFRHSFEEDVPVLLSIGLSLVSLQLIPDVLALGK